MADLNIYAKILIGLQVFGVLARPFFIGEERKGKQTGLDWLICVALLGLTLKALEVI